MTDSTQSNTQAGNMKQVLLDLGYQPIYPQGLSEQIDFYTFEQTEGDVSTLIIAIQYYDALNLKNMKPLFNEGHDILMQYVNQNPQLKVAFLILLSKGVSPSIMAMRAFTEPIIRIKSDIDMKPTVFYSPNKTGLRFLEVLTNLVRSITKSNDVDFDEKYDENTVEAAHRRAFNVAK